MSTGYTYTREDLIRFKPAHATFVGIDSDGCVFDTMEIKQKQCFHGLIISHWHLEAIAPYVREAAEFVNLYSRWRGQNRFLALVMTFDLLRKRKEVKTSGVQIPALNQLRKWIASGAPLGNPGLEKAAGETGDPELTTVLQWSQAINTEVERKVKRLPPFPWARRSLERIHATSDAICVSQTPSEALVREWKENDLADLVRIIAGQELGTKAEHIAMATKGRYRSEQVLMIGDALGDREAAQTNHALFFPINPGKEDASWERFCAEAYDKFLTGQYAGRYEAGLVAEFEALLPETPPWK
jgi:phosphoglycolate phosphatase-like HAD superfamily hydrolase